jgi:hypothetical protein
MSMKSRSAVLASFLLAAAAATEAGSPPPVPTGFSVPATSTTGIYTISWAYTPIYIRNYVLSRNGNIVYSGLNNSVTINFPYNGTFWYGLSACNEYGCRSVPLAQSVVVTLPELNLPAPTGLFSNPTSMCSWRASWSPVPGATSYVFRAASGGHGVTVTATEVNYNLTTCTQGSSSSTLYAEKPFWVMACGDSGCSTRSAFPGN